MVYLPFDLRRVCILMTDRHLGNLVLSMPVIEALVAYFKEKPTVVVDERYVPLVERLPAIGRLLSYPDQTVKRRGALRNLKPALFGLRLAIWRPKVVLDLGGPPRGAWLSVSTGARYRVGFDRSFWRCLYTQKIPYREEAHAFDRYSEFLRVIGQSGRPPWIRLSAPAAVRESLTQRLKKEQPHPGAPLMVIHPGAGKAWRCWPVERFAETADALVRRYGFDVAVIGSSGERPLAEAVRLRMRESASAFIFQGNLIDLLALFERSALFLGNESGPAHLASTTDVPMVVIFGPSKEALWRPVREKQCIVLRGAPCDPRCDRSICYAERRCLLSLTVEQTVEAAELLLAGGSPAPGRREDSPYPVAI